KANLLYKWLDYHPALKPFVKDAADRSFTVVPVVLPEGTTAQSVQEALKSQDMAVGSGYGSFKDSQIRIANFPQHTKEDIERLIKALNDIVK
ncbi:MAG TPA: phosphoserine aminotransferase, partial [candidate division Zixibacteria bacterium]|nr:phosphoserine aminotransferase [candidate division Zixibacteria bacterium]